MLKTKEQIVQELESALYMLRRDAPSVADWICSVDLLQNMLADMVILKREAIAALQEVTHVQG